MPTLTAGILMEHTVETIDSLDWERILSELDAQANALLKGILSAEECRLLAELYPKDELCFQPCKSRFVVLDSPGHSHGLR